VVRVGKKNSILNIEIGRVKVVDILLFTKHLSVTLKSGLPLMDGLEILKDQAKGKMRRVIGLLLETVKDGEPFNVALSEFPKYFSQVYLNLVKAGEFSGTLVESLERLSIDLKKRHDFKNKVRSAMIYPVMVLIAVTGLGMSIAIFVLPKILPLFTSLNVDLPFSTRILIFVAEVFEQHGIAIFIGSIVAVILLTFFLKRKFMKPIIHWFLLKLPVVGPIIKNLNLENFTRTLGLMLESGLTIDESLKIVGESMGNFIYKRSVLGLIAVVRSGDSLMVGMERHASIFPTIVSKMISVGEKTGTLEGNLKYLGIFYEEEVDETVKNLSIIIEPALLIFIGMLVGFVALSILGPIYQITGNLK